MPAAPVPFIKITNLSLIPAIAAYARSEDIRGHSFLSTLRKLMRFWLSFCIKRVRKGDRSKVEAYLIQQVDTVTTPSATSQLPAGASKRKRSRAAQIDRFRGTMVARVLRKFNIYGAKFIRNAGRFYQLCARYLSRRKAGVNVHRAALIDPLKKLHGTAPNSAKVKVSPHQLLENAKANFASIAVDAWGSARKTPQNPSPLGMQGVAGNVFHQTMHELERIAAKWLAERMVTAAEKAGFAARMLTLS